MPNRSGKATIPLGEYISIDCNFVLESSFNVFGCFFFVLSFNHLSCNKNSKQLLIFSALFDQTIILGIRIQITFVHLFADLNMLTCFCFNNSKVVGMSSEEKGAETEFKLLNDAEHESSADGNRKEDNKFKSRLVRNYACMCFYAFLTGCDFAVIIPTLWDRLSVDFNATGAFMGIVISAYSFSGVICGLLMGKLSDHTIKTKPFYLIAIVLAATGHLLYFIGINKYVILIARLISGLSLGASTVALAYVARTTSEKERIGVISIIMASRQMGLMFGPAFNIFLRKTNFVIMGQFVVNRKTVPGLFMASLWIICFFIMSIVYRDFNYKKKRRSSKTEQEIDDQEDQEQLRLKDLKGYKSNFFRIEIIVLLFITFFTYFNQTSLETIVIPFTEMMFGWNELQNSILFCIGGVVIILSYVIIRLISIKLNDRYILLIGLLSICLGLIVACSCLPFAKQLNSSEIGPSHDSSTTPNQTENFNSTLIYDIELNGNSSSTNQSLITNNSTTNGTENGSKTADYQFFPAFVVFVILDVLGLPAIAISSSTLFTKLVDDKMQGIGQGVQRGVLGVGTIFGPLFAGPFVQKPLVLLGSTLVVILLIVAFTLLSFKRLKPKAKIDKSDTN